MKDVHDMWHSIIVSFETHSYITERRMPVHLTCVPNGQIPFFFFFDFQFLKIEFCPIFYSIHFFSNFQKLSVIKNCINFQFSLTSPKVKNLIKFSTQDNKLKIQKLQNLKNSLNFQC